MEFSYKDHFPCLLNTTDKSNEFVCFFCLRQRKKHIVSTTGRNELLLSIENNFSLRNLCRFLQISPQRKKYEDGGRILGYDLEGKLSFASEHLVVSACSDCTKLTKEFTELYRILEVTKLRLKWCLEKVHCKMIDSSISNSGPEASKGVTFRTALRDRMKEKMHSFVPRLVIPKVRCPPTPTPSYDFLPACANLTELLPSKPKLKFEDHDEKEHVRSGSIPCLQKGARGNGNTTSEQVKVYKDHTIRADGSAFGDSEYDGNYVSSPTNKLTKCSFCRADFRKFHGNGNGVRIGELLLRRHVLQYHCEHLFPHHKLPSVTDSQFKLILGELLFKDLINEQDTDNNCLYCNKRFKLSQKQINRNGKTPYLNRIKHHLYQCHFGELEKLLGDIQSNPFLSSLLSHSNPDAKICECGAYLRNVSCRVVHDNYHCPWKTHGKTRRGDQILCKSCNEYVGRHNYSRHRRRRSCAAKKGRHSEVKECLEKRIKNAKGKMEGISTRTLSELKNKKQILLEKRKQNRFKDIKSNFISSSEGRNAKRVCKLCNECVSNQRNALRHWKYYCPKGEMLSIPTVGTLTCHYCPYKCVDRKDGNGKNSMKKHLVRNHPEHFFPEERDSLEEWKRNHFGRILIQILFPKFISNSASCSLCGKFYNRSNSFDLRMHLINNHMQELQVQLKDILRQSDASLEKMLQSKSGLAEEEVHDDELLGEAIIPIGKERLKDLLVESNSNSITSRLSENEVEIPMDISESECKVKEEPFVIVPTDTDPDPVSFSGFAGRSFEVVRMEKKETENKKGKTADYSEEIPMDISECKVNGGVVVRSTDMDPVTIRGFSMNGNNNSSDGEGQDFSEQDDLMMNVIVKDE